MDDLGLAARSPEPVLLHRWSITRFEDSYWCSARGRRVALALGFEAPQAWAVAIAISELVSNAIKFGGRGTLTLLSVPGGPDSRPGLEIRVADPGAGFDDLDTVVQDDFSEGRDLNDPALQIGPRRSLGAGLGAVHRFMDHLEASRPLEGGFVILCRKYL